MEWVIDIYIEAGRWTVTEDSWYRENCRSGCNGIPMNPCTLEDCVSIVRARCGRVKDCIYSFRFRNIVTGEIIPYEVFA